MLGANSRVVAKVTIAAMPSSRLARQARRKFWKLIRLNTASIMIAASTGLGR